MLISIASYWQPGVKRSVYCVFFDLWPNRSVIYNTHDEYRDTGLMLLEQQLQRISMAERLDMLKCEVGSQLENVIFTSMQFTWNAYLTVLDL